MENHEVASPLPGTFYRRPNPEADPYVEEGDSVSADDTICLIEVMKQFHEVKVGATGTLVRFLVANEDAVSAGQALAVVEPA